ncbi:YcxB family protein [Shimia sp. Alg240-R146]|uniref:YcxB family protein n=1 Tax=Shimia sp. Alg240-R146 TaxID=2993449 RepID=UPI0022DF814D|nr:YcxB family protein [Shimia sp. Alg240-R146]
MTFEFEQSGPVDAKVMARAIKGCPKKHGSLRSRIVSFALGSFLAAVLGVGGIAIAIGVAFKVGYGQIARDMPVVFGGLFLALLLWKLAFAYNFRVHVGALLKSPIYSGNTRFSFGKEGLSMATDNAKWEVKWPAVTGFKATADGFFFYSGAFVYVLPSTAFGNADRDTFVGAINERRAAA